MAGRLSRLFTVEDKTPAHVDFVNGICWDADGNERTPEVFRVDDHTYVYIPEAFWKSNKDGVDVLKTVVDPKNGCVNQGGMGKNGYVSVSYKTKARIIGKLRSGGCGPRLGARKKKKSLDGRSDLIFLDCLIDHEMKKIIETYPLPQSLTASLLSPQ